jgi:hypothetical protein
MDADLPPVSCVIFCGMDYTRISFQNRSPKLLINDRAIVMPDDGMVYVLGCPTLHLERVEVRAEDLERHLDGQTMDAFYQTDGWINNLQPVLRAHQRRN